MFINYTELINSIKSKRTMREYKDNSQISYIYESSFTINKLTSYNSAHIDYVHLIFYFLSIIVMHLSYLIIYIFKSIHYEQIVLSI